MPSAPESAAPIDGGQHRVGVLAEVPRLLLEHGLEPNGVVRAAGLAPEQLRNPENAIPLAAAARLAQLCAEATNLPHFGALLGRRGGTYSLGLVGRLMRSAPTVGEAISDLCTNQHRYIRGAVTYVVTLPDVIFWGYATQAADLEGAVQMCEGAAGIGCSILSEIAGIAPAEVLLARKTPADKGRYVRVFGAPVRFEAEQFAVLLRREQLDLPVRTSDRTLRSILQKQVAAYWALREPSLADRVRRILTARVLSQTASALTVAADLRLTERTLNRRLEAEFTTFRKLTNEARYNASRHLMSATNLPLTDIALALGYASPSAFSRAFGDWSGTNPSAWRAESRRRADAGVAANP
jgi:AraC-like DNA-binding protein